MILNPEVQRKGQEEISRVCDSSQLPSYDDVDSLPYVTAIALEVLRWTCPAPLGITLFRFNFNRSYSLIFVGVPHYIDRDDTYNGYLIPGQSMVIANLWSGPLCFPSTPVC
jgi:hypothetical protein